MNSSPSVWWKANWTRFSFRILPVLISIPFIFILKNSTVLKVYKHTHNMMQPSLCFKIWRVVLRNVLYWICPKRNTLYSGQNVFKKKLCSKWFDANRCMQYFWVCSGFLLFNLSIRLVLQSNYNVVDPSSVFSNHSHVTVLKSPLAILLKSLSGFLPFQQLS